MSLIAALLMPLAVPQDRPWPDAVVDGKAALKLFVDACWRGIRDEAIFTEALGKSTTPFKEEAGRYSRIFSDGKVEVEHAKDRVCTVRFRVASDEVASALPDEVSQRLGLAAGTLWRTADISPAPTIWNWPIVPPGRGGLALWLRVEGHRYDQRDGPAEVSICVVEGGGRC